MRALSLWQPWASLWCSRRKRHETRSWPLRHRGWLAVHAAKISVCSAMGKTFGVPGPITDEEKDFREILEDEFGGHYAMDLPRGAVIGAVYIIDCVETKSIMEKALAEGLIDSEVMDDFTCGNFTVGRFGFLRSEFKLLPRPVPFKGRQGLFDVPDDIFTGLLELPKNE